MAKFVVLSGDHQTIDEIASAHADIEKALRSYFTSPDIHKDVSLFDERPDELVRRHLDHVRQNASLSLLTALEAAFCIDFLIRSQERRRDGVSRAMRALKRETEKLGRRVSLTDDLFAIWSASDPHARSIVHELRSAYKYRNWLAHGRYWQPKLGRRYSFEDLYEIATIAITHFRLLR